MTIAHRSTPRLDCASRTARRTYCVDRNGHHETLTGTGTSELIGPERLRDTIAPGVRLLALANRDVAAAGATTRAAGHRVDGPIHTIAGTGVPVLQFG